MYCKVLFAEHFVLTCIAETFRVYKHLNENLYFLFNP